ncbi:MAG TPA: hypothetical protein VN843_13120 [Anaerolineales bacterium]|nr:hypothetical protein [Anaerolineales bacterium]
MFKISHEFTGPRLAVVLATTLHEVVTLGGIKLTEFRWPTASRSVSSKERGFGMGGRLCLPTVA